MTVGGDPGRTTASRARSRAAQQRPRGRALRTRRLLLLAAAVAAVVVVALVLRPDGPDPFPGVYWDTASGRRVEITHDGSGYRFLYGVARHGYPAERHGDELRVRDPFSGYLVVRSTGEGLVLVQGQRESRLEPLAGGD